MVIHGVVSGGQTGVDRAALDAAIAVGLGYGGWVPRGGTAEDLPEPPGLLARYPDLRATESADPAVRTRHNARDSDATLVLRPDGWRPSPGTELTVQVAHELGRPLALVDPGEPGAEDQVVGFVASLGRPVVLNVAGPRESQCPGVYRSCLPVLVESLRRLR